MKRARNQRGSSMIFVSIVGLVISLMLGLFLNSSVLVESRAVEAELARSRAYWQQMGTFNYALSRISYSKLCGSGCTGNQSDVQAAAVLQAYFNELNNIKSYSYLDESPNYTIETSATAAADNTAGRHNFSGHLMATSTYTTSTLVGASAGKLPLLELRFCSVVDPKGKGGKCGKIDENNGSNRYPYFSIGRLTNLPVL